MLFCLEKKDLILRLCFWKCVGLFQFWLLFSVSGCCINNSQCGWPRAGCLRQHVCTQQFQTREAGSPPWPLRRYGPFLSGKW